MNIQSTDSVIEELDGTLASLEVLQDELGRQSSGFEEGQGAIVEDIGSVGSASSQTWQHVLNMLSEQHRER